MVDEQGKKKRLYMLCKKYAYRSNEKNIYGAILGYDKENTCGVILVENKKGAVKKE